MYLKNFAREEGRKGWWDEWGMESEVGGAIV
jgi:hypothetical protein